MEDNVSRGQRYIDQWCADTAHHGTLVSLGEPDLIVPGYRGSLIAIRGYGRRRFLYVIYREVAPDDGFIITAYFSASIDRKKAIWKRP